MQAVGDGAGTSAVSCVIRSLLRCCELGVERPKSVGISGLVVGAPGPTSVAASLPPGLWAPLRLEGWIPGSPCCYCWGSGASGSGRPQLENRIAARPALPRVPPPVWVPVHPLLTTLCGVLHILGCWAEALSCFVACLLLWMEGERQRQLFGALLLRFQFYVSRIC